MAGHRSFGQQLPYSLHSVFLYGWKINKLLCRYQNFTPATMWFVVRKSSKHKTPLPSLRYVDNVTYCISQCALFLLKHAKDARFWIPTQMRKNFMWMFRLLSSTAMTPVIIQIWRLIFVLKHSSLRFRKRTEICMTCDTELSCDWTVSNIDFKSLFLILKFCNKTTNVRI
jgi:hypothetical protein